MKDKLMCVLRSNIKNISENKYFSETFPTFSINVASFGSINLFYSAEKESYEEEEPYKTFLGFTKKIRVRKYRLKKGFFTITYDDTNYEVSKEFYLEIKNAVEKHRFSKKLENLNNLCK